MKRAYWLVWLLVLVFAGESWAHDPKPVVFHAARTADNDGVATAINTRGYSSIGLDITIANTATVTVQGRSSVTGTYQTIPCFNRTTNEPASSFTLTATVQCNVTDLENIKIPITGCSSCTVSVRGLIGNMTSEVVAYFEGLLAGEDPIAGVFKVESRYTRTAVTADTQIKASPGYVEKISCTSNDADPTDGTITVYDNTAESGTILYQAFFSSGPVYVSEFIHAPAAIGIYIGYATVDDVKCWVNWR